MHFCITTTLEEKKQIKINYKRLKANFHCISTSPVAGAQQTKKKKLTKL